MTELQISNIVILDRLQRRVTVKVQPILGTMAGWFVLNSFCPIRLYPQAPMTVASILTMQLPSILYTILTTSRHQTNLALVFRLKMILRLPTDLLLSPVV